MHVATRVTIAILLVAAPAAAQLAKPKTDTLKGGIVRVTNTGPSGWVGEGWQVIPERIVQPPDGAPGMLEKPDAVLLMADGRVIVSQLDPASIALYDAHGTFVRTLGRAGEGPGEYRFPKIALFHDTLVIHDQQMSRMTLMTTEGKVLRSFPTPVGIRSIGTAISVDHRGWLRIRSSRRTPEGSSPQWVYFDMMGVKRDSVAPPMATRGKTWDVLNANGLPSASYAVPLAPVTGYAFPKSGGVLFGSTDHYEFVLSRTGRDTSRLIARQGLVPVPIPAAVRDSIFQQSTRIPEVRAVANSGDMSRTYGLWDQLAVDDDGNFWLSSRRANTNKVGIDVFTPDGRLLGAVGGAVFDFRLASWNRDHVAVLGTDANELPVIRIFRIERRGH